ncbi:MAG TPA: peptidase S58 family protein [Candidatus Hydrogenedentes bacterium]|nr:peptidase S58 family protein [Candidatus Hydrogenedentota bacterium]
MAGSLTDVRGLKVGHYTDPVAATGCTVVLCERGAVPGVHVSGASPGGREIELLRPGYSAGLVHGILLSGGSAYGLDAAAGVMRYLEERGAGYDTVAGVVPLVPAAIIYDLSIGDSCVRPTPENAYDACCSATEIQVAEGSVGAGTGASVGKCLGAAHATKGGIGMASVTLSNDVVVAALIVVNAWGDVIDPCSRVTVAGPRELTTGRFLRTADLLKANRMRRPFPTSNTVIGVIATNVRLRKNQTHRLAQMAQVGLARTVDPCGSMYDGDTLFVLSAGDRRCDMNVLGVGAVEVVEEAVLRAVHEARTVAGVPALCDLKE